MWISDSILLQTTAYRISHRPLLYVKSYQDYILATGTDHLVYKICPSSTRSVSTFDSVSSGHKDWVIGACSMDSKIYSAGQDCRVIEWSSASKSKILHLHQSSLSQISSNTLNNILTSSYDGSIVSHTCQNSTLLLQSPEPIVNFEWTLKNEILASSRKGKVFILKDACLADSFIVSNSAIQRILVNEPCFTSQRPIFNSNTAVFATSSLDQFCVFDLRISKSLGRCVSRLKLSDPIGGLASAGEHKIALNQVGKPDIALFDLRRIGRHKFQNIQNSVKTISTGSCCYALESDSKIILSSWGDGSVVLDSVNGQDRKYLRVDALKYDYGGESFNGLRNAMRSLEISSGTIAAAGDDGIVAVWKC